MRERRAVREEWGEGNSQGYREGNHSDRGSKRIIGEAWGEREREAKQDEKGRPCLATPIWLPSVRLIIWSSCLKSSSYLKNKLNYARDHRVFPLLR